MFGNTTQQGTISLAPVALFVYNRPWHTRQTIESLQKNDLAVQSDLFIFSDGAKSAESQADVQKVREYIRSIVGFKTITIIEREENWGLAKSIIGGVTQLCAEFGRVIVLEDDLVTSLYFLRFMNDGLNFYENDSRVMHISGYMFPIEQEDLPDTFFIAPASCWGWATWGRAWDKFEKNTEELLRIFTRKTIQSFNLGGAYDYFGQVRENQQGKIDTWAVYWYASVFLAGGLSLHPKISFVSNIGHDGSGTNCSKNSQLKDTVASTYDISFEIEVKKSAVATVRLTKYFSSLRRSLLKRIIRKIHVVLNRITTYPNRV